MCGCTSINRALSITGHEVFRSVIQPPLLMSRPYRKNLWRLHDLLKGGGDPCHSCACTQAKCDPLIAWKSYTTIGPDLKRNAIKWNRQNWKKMALYQRWTRKLRTFWASPGFLRWTPPISKKYTPKPHQKTSQWFFLWEISKFCPGQKVLRRYMYICKPEYWHSIVRELQRKGSESYCSASLHLIPVDTPEIWYSIY